MLSKYGLKICLRFCPTRIHVTQVLHHGMGNPAELGKSHRPNRIRSLDKLVRANDSGTNKKDVHSQYLVFRYSRRFLLIVLTDFVCDNVTF